jgi:tubulin-folding cofactor B
LSKEKDDWTMADITVIVTSDLTSSERRISPTLTLSQLKAKLETITGIPPPSQRLVVYASNGSAPTTIDLQDNSTVADCGIRAQYRIHVNDTRPKDQQIDFNDVQSTERYEMPAEEYAAREDSVLAWKRRNNLGRFDPNMRADLDSDAQTSRQAADQKGIKVGARCQVNSLKRGTVRYVGPVPEIKGSHRVWVGVEYDEPVGRHDGAINGSRYFSARTNTGAFVKPEAVEIGDFPEEDLFDDDEI